MNSRRYRFACALVLGLLCGLLKHPGISLGEATVMIGSGVDKAFFLEHGYYTPYRLFTARQAAAYLKAAILATTLSWFVWYLGVAVVVARFVFYGQGDLLVAHLTQKFDLVESLGYWLVLLYIGVTLIASWTITGISVAMFLSRQTVMVTIFYLAISVALALFGVHAFFPSLRPLVMHVGCALTGLTSLLKMVNILEWLFIIVPLCQMLKWVITNIKKNMG